MSRTRIFLIGLVTAVVTVVQSIGSGQAGPPATLTVAAASDLQFALPELAGRFEKETRTKTTLSFGSSGNFFAQIQNGAPFDVFFSADLDYPKRLIADGYADGDTLYHYATGRIVVWARKDIDLSIDRGLAALADARVRRVAVANPEHAPYGRAAVAALRREGLYERVQSKLVFGENISQTAQLVESGNAEVGILALSLALAPALAASGRYMEIAASAHPPLDQAAVIVSGSRNKPAARALLAFMKRPESGELLRQFGFRQR